MQLTSFVSLAAFAIGASAGNIHVNYYSDGGCADYISSPPNVPTGFACYNWDIDGANSANIADCTGYTTCTCAFFNQPNCAGASQPVSFGIDNGNCASNFGHGFQSFRCQGLN